MNAELRPEWAQRLIKVVCGETWGDGTLVMDVGMGYAEPGYHDNVTTWVLGSWWVRGDDGKLEIHRLSAALERAGIEVEWHDEWEKCSHCARIFRTSGDSYMWKQFGIQLEDGDWLCGECAIDPEFIEDVLQPFIDNPHNRVSFCDASVLEAQGWTRYNEHAYQSGWHPGMDANPTTVFNEIQERMPEHNVLFFKDEASQFYSEWSVFTRPKAFPLIELELTCKSCPEQYDAYIDGEEVGYLRLRHGQFTVQFPDVDGECVYDKRTQGDGEFAESERQSELNAAKTALAVMYSQKERVK